MKSLKVGQWWLLEYGFSIDKWYIIEVHKECVKVGKKNYLAFDGHWITMVDFNENNKGLIGQGKLKWYWKYLPWRSFTCPYSLP